MANDWQDAARDEMFEQISRELYPEHKQQAIEEFAAERLRSFYLAHPTVMLPAMGMLKEGRELLELRRFTASVVFSAGSYELMLKATLLRPVVHGLVHNEGLAQVLVDHMLGTQTAIGRYKELLSKLFLSIAGVQLATVSRAGVKANILAEVIANQTLRNRILHGGGTCTRPHAEEAREVGLAVFQLILSPVLVGLGLGLDPTGRIVLATAGIADLQI
ncbi:hypothetical protein [Rugamonas rubra]|uniref:Uncharacterized protein n=1 Tax=Rugamonas rubra TaxID=758825 RepID=A0A1I4SL91_9BURK|nr:hypothetical protein [Rugamonas rubra]SFM65192.1 hypothetical protein SAMN02982985_04843 [Rugamonas rubra]